MQSTQALDPGQSNQNEWSMQKRAASLPEKLSRLGPSQENLRASGRETLCSSHGMVCCLCRQTILRIKKSHQVGVFLEVVIGAFVFHRMVNAENLSSLCEVKEK